MSLVKKALSSTWEYFKVDDPSTFRDEYIDKTIDRERKPKPEPTGWQKVNLLSVYNWYPSHYSSYERKFLMKFDATVFFFLCASFYTKYLDTANISTAYVAGMKEDLNLNGNELNMFNTYYTIGYAIFQIPVTLLITRPKYSRYLLIICELIWGSLTLANAFAKNAQQVYAIRFLIGLSEACSFPATYVVLSSYLTDEELFKRAGVYGAFSAAGSASSGSLQTITTKTLHMVGGLEGWRWQFIIDAVITLGIVIYGFLLYPGIPTTTKRFGLFTEDDMIFARKRLENKVAIPKKFTMDSVKETFSTWQVYACTFLWVTHHQSFYDSGIKLYLKSRTDLYTQTEVTDLITYTKLVSVGVAILCPPLAVFYGKIPVATFGLSSAYYAAIILIVWNLSNSWMLSAFSISFLFRSGLAQTYYSWSATLCKDNVEKKAIVLSIMNCLSYATQAWLIPIQYNLKNSPNFRAGYKGNLGIVVLDTLAFAIVYILDKYDLKLIPKYAGHRHTNKDGIMAAEIGEGEEGYHPYTKSTSSISEAETTSNKEKSNYKEKTIGV